MSMLLLQFLAHTVLIVIFCGPILLIWRLRSRACLPWGILWFWLGLMLWMPSSDSLTVISTSLLEFSAHTVLIAILLGPILLICRLGLRAGLPWGVLWFWLGLILWVRLVSAVDLANYRLHYHADPHIDPDDDLVGFFMMFSVGFPLSLIYCGLLSLLSVLVRVITELAGELKDTLREIEAYKRRE